MKKLSLFLLPALLLVAGCGDSKESLVKESISLMNDMADILEGVKDEKSAKAAEKKLEGLTDDFVSLAKKAQKIQEKEKDKSKEAIKKEEKDLKAKYEPQMKKAQERMEAAMKKLKDVPGADKMMMNFGIKFMKAMKDAGIKGSGNPFGGMGM